MNGYQNLDELLDELEVKISRIGQLGHSEAERLLGLMDQAHERILILQERKLPSKAQEAQFAYLVAGLEKNARQFLGDLGGQDGLAQLRSQYHPGAERTWWFLDRTLRQRRRRTMRRILLDAGIALLVLFLSFIAYRTFLAPDPAVSASYAHQMNAGQYLAKGEYHQALNEVQMALVDTPDDVELLILKGTIETKLGQETAADADFQAARQKIGSEDEFRLIRAQQWLAVGDPQRALADARFVIQDTPTSAQGYFYLGKAQEALQQTQAAIDSYQTASQLAQSQGQTQLEATIRISLALLMQSMPAQLPTNTISPTP